MNVVTRENLHKLVWQRPIGQISRQYGVTAARLRDACKFLHIPIPPAGHWANVRAGLQSAPAALPEHDGPASYMLSSAPKESLVDWVMRARATPPPIVPRKAASTASQRQLAPPGQPLPQARYMPLKDWGKLVFGESAPHQNTLIRWAKEGFIQPKPRKIARTWWVTPAAEYRDD